MKIALTSIPVNNPAEAFKFYTETLGFREKMFMPEMQIAIVVSPEEPDGTALLLEPNENPLSKTWQEGLYKSGIPVMVFGTTDINAECERLKGLGVKFKSEPQKTEFGTIAVFEDTCGNYVQLHQP